MGNLFIVIFRWVRAWPCVSCGWAAALPPLCGFVTTWR